jgi:hypothetical protein
LACTGARAPRHLEGETRAQDDGTATTIRLFSKLWNFPLNRSQESGVAGPRNHFHYNSLTVPV